MPLTLGGAEGIQSFAGLGQACVSQRKGRQPGRFPHKGKEAEFIQFLEECLAPQIARPRET